MDNHWVLPDDLPREIAVVILNTGIVGEQPVLTWEGSPKPDSWKLTANFHANLEDKVWYKFIWHKGCALRYSCYAWMTLKGNLKTIDNLSIRGIPVLTGCSFCEGNLENHSHIFFYCDFSFTILSSLLHVLKKIYLRPNLLQVYDLLDNCQDLGKKE